MEENKVNLPLLVEQLKTGNGVIPFVGAGLSIPLGFPGWTKFLLEQGQSAGIKKEIENRINAGEYEEAAEDLLNALKGRAFQDNFKYAYGDHNLENKELDGAVSLLPQLASGPVITTNFDHVLENIFTKYNCGFEHKVWGAKVDLVPEALHGNKRFLLKIHGDVDDRTERILTLSEYEKNYGSTDTSKTNLDLPLLSLLNLMLTSRPLLFLGCSLNKDRTLETLKKVVQDNPGIAHYAIVEMPNSEALFHEKVSYLSEHGIRPIWYPTGQHDLIKSLLEYLIKRVPSSSRIMPPQSTNNRLLSGPDDTLLEHRSGFFGRKEDVKKIITFFSSDKSIGTVTASHEVYNVRGAPGIGKTEVCKEALKQYLSDNPGKKAYHVELSEANDKAGFIARLAEAVGTQQEDKNQVLHAFSSSPGIVYLDNLEDVIADEGSIGLLLQLVTIPGVQVLASSREILGGIADNIPIVSLDLESATQLFIHEWERSNKEVPIENSQELKDFLDKDLECHPLSIVLIAAQAYHYNSLKRLRDAWLEEAMALAKLQHGKETPLTSLDVSLSKSFKVVFRELPEGIQFWGIMGLFPEGLSPLAWNVRYKSKYDKMSKLLNRLSITYLEHDGTFKMLAPLRQFILDRAKKAEGGLDNNMLAEIVFPYYDWLAKEAYDHSFDEEHTQTLDALLAEFPNLHFFILFAKSLDGNWPDKLSSLSFHLSNYYQYRILLGEELLQILSELQRSAGMALPLARSIESLGDLEGRLGKPDDALKHYNEAIELYRKERHDLGLANAITSLGDLEGRLGKPDDALKHYNEAIELYRKERDDLGLANAYQSLGDLMRILNEYEKAKNIYLEAKGLYISEKENTGLSYTCSELARVSHALGDSDGCNGFIEEAVNAAIESDIDSVFEYAMNVQKELFRI
ncbi:MAG TPA: tetratricopeptide repeat protein [archaeon]|nr:tetratricopeptide repeat protein [archaeon]